jgi:arylsulfatase A-like enzyme
MNSRCLLLFTALVVLTGVQSPAAPAGSRPNILVILADDLGYGELGCQGFTREIPTPHIDSLAQNGVRFTNGYVSGTYCSPTRAGLMTGRYQQRFGHEFNPGPAATTDKDFGLSLNEVTIASRLKDAGYATGWFGKSHLGYEPPFHPLKRGFDEYFGFLGGAHSYIDAEIDPLNPILRGTTPTNDIGGYTTEAFARETVAFIRKHRGQSWFAYLAFNAVHNPLQAPEKYLRRFAPIADTRRRTYAAMQSAMDDAVGSVLGTLRELKLEENTLIFFFSDNGGPTPQTTSSNGPLRGYKSQTWEGGIRIAYIVQWKGRLPAGKVDDRPVIQLDIHPTALAAAGIAIRPDWKLDGVNLLPFLTGEKAGVPHAALCWRFGSQVAIRMGDWKLVKGAGMPGITVEAGTASMDGAELYNLARDIGEKQNLAGSEPEKVKQLAAAWNAWNTDNIDPKWRPARAAGGKKAGAKKKRSDE